MDKKTRFIAAKKKFQEEHRRLGLCYDCNNRPDDGKTRCSSCMANRKASEQARRSNAVAVGLCSHCCRLPKLASHRLCEPCYLKDISHKHFRTSKFWAQLKDKFIAQGGKCALSGCDLTIGVNAELDHINPSSRGGESELDNVQWVLCVVNRMKDHMTETEFFGLVKCLYFTMKG